MAADRWSFLGREIHLPDAGCFREPRDLPPLWIYHLHYFRDLVAEDWDQRADWHRAWLQRWLTEIPPGHPLAWDPYPISLRIVNWIKYALAGGTLSPRALNALADQARTLLHRREHHLRGNHLLANAKALFFAGLFFEGEEPDAWMRTARAILAVEIPEQVLPDGGHVERSAMYQAIVAEDLLDLLNLSQTFGVDDPDIRHRIPAMLRWARSMNHPDGDIALFNDAARGQTPTRSQLEAYAERLDLELPALSEAPLVHLRDSGFVRIAMGQTTAFLEVAGPGPAYQPGHAHAGTLGFELSLGNRRLFVDTGTSRYDPCPERLAQRKTEAHNTLVVDGHDASEVWSSFRVARRATVRDVHTEQDAGAIRVAATQDGYRRIPGLGDHRREWHFDGPDLTIRDTMDGNGRHDLVQIFQLGPGFRFADDGCRIIDDRGTVARLAFGENTVQTITSFDYHPGFWQREPCWCLRVCLQTDLPATLETRITFAAEDSR